MSMEEKISGAESRGAAPDFHGRIPQQCRVLFLPFFGYSRTVLGRKTPNVFRHGVSEIYGKIYIKLDDIGLLFQSFLNALQQRSSKTSQNSRLASESTVSKPSSSCSDTRSIAAEKDDVDLDDVESWKASLSSTRNKINQTWIQYSPTFRDKVQKYSPNSLKKLKTLFTLPEEKDADPDAEGMDDDKGADELSFTERNDPDDAVPDETAITGGLGNLRNDSSQTRKVPSEINASLDKSESSADAIKSNEMKDHPPCIILEEADSDGNCVKNIDPHSEKLHLRKSPLTVQEWVDHLPIKTEIIEKDCDDSLGTKDLDNHPVSDTLLYEEKKALLAQKLSREASVQSSSSLDSILDSRRPDPVEVLLNLGFGGVPGVDMYNCRIPKRFLVPSKCKGGDWNEFLKRELLQAQNFECASLGFRGLSGPSYRRPSAIVANIMEKLREGANPRHPVTSKFSIVAKRILNEKSVLNKLVPPSQSVLSPDSRKFADNQGKISPEVPRRRIIFGQKSFRFGNDGEFVEVESAKKVNEKESPVLVDSSSADSDCGEEKVNAGTIPSPDLMLKLRRSSLKRQKKIEEESEISDLDLCNEGRCSILKESYRRKEEYSKKDKQIPMRFISSSNLRQPIGDGISKTLEELKLEVDEEIRTLSQKIQNTNSAALSSVLLKIKKLSRELENSCGQWDE